MGNHDNKTPKSEGIFSSKGDADILTPLFDNFSIKLGSFGEYVVIFLKNLINKYGIIKK